MVFAEVAVDSPAGPNRTFSYAVPPSLDVRPGHIVRVPFGSRTLQGVVVELEPVPQVPETRQILGVIGPEALSDSQLALARWISQYYVCSLFDAAAPMLPPGSRIRSKVYVTLAADHSESIESELPDSQRRLLEYVRRRRRVEESRLLDVMGRGARSALARLVDRGLVLRAAGRDRPAARRRYREYVQVSNVAPELAGLARRAPRQEAFVSRLLAADKPLVLAEARREYGAGAVNAVLAKGWAEKMNVAEERDPLAGTAFPSTGPVVLTRDQAAVASEIRLSLETSGPSPRTFLVHGVTGSGKTEIYLDAAHHCLRLGKRAIILVPEIALTHQTIERFAARFPGEVAVLHSGLSAGERFDQWWKIKQGEYGLVVGSRGAVFAPQPDLGLIVIDEEHEWTYKQVDSTPRYHAREVAFQLAKLTGAVVVLGSATPDVGSYYNAARGRSRLASLPDRVIPVEGDSSKGAVSTPLASVDVVDMRRELREGNRNIFSRILTDSLRRCLVAGEQAILFLNRRGSASYMLCRNCGASLRCRRCDVSLTYHKALDRLVCHYCGYRRIPPTSCPRCLGYRLSFYGIGTQSVAAEVSEKFPEAKVLRWDRDAVKNARSYQEMLRLFRAGEAQVLVGTQMIAKGLHFPSVTLVGVVSADVGLNIPDYQAGERAFQLLYQVAGRAGRGRAGGRVIVQTYQPDNYAVQAAASQDYQRFFSKEAEFRREQGNPPFSKLVRLLYTHTNSALCEREASRLAGLIRRQSEEWGISDVELLGPTPAFPPRVRGRYRWQMVLRGSEPRRLLETVAVPKGWVVDVDPVGAG